MRSKLDPSPIKEDRINFAVDAEQKRRIFEAAARSGTSTSQFIRDTILRAAEGAKQAAA